MLHPTLLQFYSFTILNSILCGKEPMKILFINTWTKYFSPIILFKTVVLAESCTSITKWTTYRWKWKNPWFMQKKPSQWEWQDTKTLFSINKIFIFLFSNLKYTRFFISTHRKSWSICLDISVITAWLQ